VFPRERNSASRVRESASRRVGGAPSLSICSSPFLCLPPFVRPVLFPRLATTAVLPFRPFSLAIRRVLDPRFSRNATFLGGEPASLIRRRLDFARQQVGKISSRRRFSFRFLSVSSAIANGARVARSSEHETLHACGATPGGRDAQRRRARRRNGKSARSGGK